MTRKVNFILEKELEKLLEDLKRENKEKIDEEKDYEFVEKPLHSPPYLNFHKNKNTKIQSFLNYLSYSRTAITFFTEIRKIYSFYKTYKQSANITASIIAYLVM